MSKQEEVIKKLRAEIKALDEERDVIKSKRKPLEEKYDSLTSERDAIWDMIKEIEYEMKIEKTKNLKAGDYVEVKTGYDSENIYKLASKNDKYLYCIVCYSIENFIRKATKKEYEQF